MPIVRTLGDGLAATMILRDRRHPERHEQRRCCRGWTTTGCGMDEAIAEACAAGYAESDPSVRSRRRRRGGEAGHPVRARLSACASAPSAIDTRSTADIGAAEFAGRSCAAAPSARWHMRSTIASGGCWTPGWHRPSCRARRCSRPSTARATRRSSRARYAGDIMLSGRVPAATLRPWRSSRRADHRTRSRGDRAGAGPGRPPRIIQGFSDHHFAEAV